MRTIAGSLILSLGICVLPGAFGLYAQQPEYSQYSVGASPGGITQGPDGNLWFAGFQGSAVGKITPAGVATVYTTPSSNSRPNEIVRGPDGNLWFTESGANKIGKVTPGGVITEYPVPGANPISAGPMGITQGPDGSLWFTEVDSRKIGKITTSGVITEYTPPGAGTMNSITTGPDGNLWFTDFSKNRIGKMTPDGVTAGYYTVPTDNSGVWEIIAGTDGNLWFSEATSSKIGKITTSGVITEYPVLTPNSQVFGLTNGSDGNIWFTEQVTYGKIGRITPGGTVTEYALPGAVPVPYNLTSGPDGNLWIADVNDSQIDKLALVSVYLSASPMSLSFNPLGSSPYPSQTVQVNGVGGTAVGFTYSATSTGNWLSVSASSLTTPATLTVSAYPGAQTPGTYSGSIAIALSGGSAITIPVVLEVPMDPNVVATPSYLSFSYQSGSGAPPTQTIQVNGVSGGAVPFTAVAASTGQWFGVSPGSGITPAALVVSVPGTLSPGFYGGTVTVYGGSGATGSSVTTVTVLVTPNPNVVVGPASLAFVYQAGGAMPAAQYIRVEAANGGFLSFTTVTVSAGNWLSVRPDTSHTPVSLQVSVEHAALSPGLYSGTIMVVPSGRGAVPPPVTVWLTVLAPPESRHRSRGQRD